MTKQHKHGGMARTACGAVFASVLLAAAACVSGCASVTYSSPRMLNGIEVKGTDNKPRQLVYISTDGFYFLWSVPIASGDLRWNNKKKTIEGGCSLFTDQVSIDELQNALVKLAEARNCDLMDVTYNDSDTSMGGASYEGLIGFLFGSSRMSVSAVMVPRN